MTDVIRTCVENAERQVQRFSQHTVDTFATCGFNVSMVSMHAKIAQCGPRLKEKKGKC